jgi:hypothetical protein
MLVEAGADVELPDREATPLEHAKSRGFREIAKILEEKLGNTKA